MHPAIHTFQSMLRSRLLMHAAMVTADGPRRPELVTQASRTGESLYYFGVGSNMLRSKLVNRGLNGSTIDIEDFQPAVVRGHRLAFNMRGVRAAGT
jgi:hypothetical protein